MLTRKLIPTIECRCGLLSADSAWIESPKTGLRLDIRPIAFHKLSEDLREKFRQAFTASIGTARFTHVDLLIVKAVTRPCAGIGLAYGWKRRKGKPMPPAPEPLKPHAEPNIEPTESPIGPGCLRYVSVNDFQDGYSEARRYPSDWD